MRVQWLWYFTSKAIKSPPTSLVRNSVSFMYVAYNLKRASSYWDITSCSRFCSVICIQHPGMKQVLGSNFIVWLWGFFLLHTGTVLVAFFLSFDKIFKSFVLEIWAFHEACHFAFLLLNTSSELLDKERNTCKAEWKIFGSLSAVWFCSGRIAVLVYICEICLTSLLLNRHLRGFSVTSWYSTHKLHVIESVSNTAL